MSEEIQKIDSAFLDDIRKNSGLTIAMGVIVLLMGLLAIGSPFIAGLSIAMVVGILFIIGGIGQLAFAFQTGRRLLNIILGGLTAIVGVYMVMNPAAALASLTIFLAAYLIVSGIFEVIMAFQIRPVSGWGWELFSGIISVLLGAMIWNQFPLSGAWAIGVLLGVKLFFSGWTLLMFGLASKGMAKEAAGAV
jgi:uncharacterized membrane protein HdeD (DUF308 family)